MTQFLLQSGRKHPGWPNRLWWSRVGGLIKYVSDICTFFCFPWFKHMTESKAGGPGSAGLVTGLYSSTGSTVRVKKWRLALKSSTNLFSPDRIQNPGWLAEKPPLQTTKLHEVHVCGFVTDIRTHSADLSSSKHFLFWSDRTNGLSSASFMC